LEEVFAEELQAKSDPVDDVRALVKAKLIEASVNGQLEEAFAAELQERGSGEEGSTSRLGGTRKAAQSAEDSDPDYEGLGGKDHADTAMPLPLPPTEPKGERRPSRWRTARCSALAVHSGLALLGMRKVSPQADFYLFAHVSKQSEVRRYLEPHAKDLVDLLAGAERKGVLVLYTAPGDMWKKMVLLVHDSRTAADFALRGPQEIAAMAAAKGERLSGLRSELEALQQHCYSLMQEMEARYPQLADLHRIRIVSPLDFCTILDSIMTRLPKDFMYWLQNTTYDVPKLVDAILRLRGLGNSVPVMRFDEDVLFNKYSLADGMARIKSSVAEGVNTFRGRQQDVATQSWVSSGQYVHLGLPEFSAEDRRKFVPWNEGFSTRCNPALLATPGLCQAAQFEHEATWVPTDSDLEEGTLEDAMMQFYGLEAADKGDQGAVRTARPSLNPNDSERRTADLARLGNTMIGANPMRAVVSGAALNMPSGVILDLPPFSHFRLNVMWIDDHCLGRSAADIGGTTHCDTTQGKGNVVKARSKPGNCAWYTLEVYMPTLLYGCIMDAWINNSEDAYLLKCLPEDLPTDFLRSKARALGLRLRETPLGPLSLNIRKILTTGRMHDKEELDALQEQLWGTALERTRDIYWQWSQLPQLPALAAGGGPAAARAAREEATPTFASLWATSSVSSHKWLAPYCEVPWASNGGGQEAVRKLRIGAGLVHPKWHQAAQGKSRADLPILRATDLNPYVYQGVKTLVKNALTHLEWVLVWPSVVQAVRSVRIGRCPSDICHSFPWTGGQ